MRIPRPVRRAAVVCGALPLLASCSDATGPEPRVTKQREVRLPGVTRVLYSPGQGMLYALQEDGSGSSVVEIDPRTGRVGRRLRDVFSGAPSSGTSAAVSTDAPFLYLWQGDVVRRIALDRMRVDLTVTMESGYRVASVVPLPGSPDAFAVILWRHEVRLGVLFSAPVGAAVYDGATPRPVRYTPPAHPPRNLVALSGTRLLGFGLYRVHDLAIGSSGVAGTEVRNVVLSQPGVSWYAAGPYVISSIGEVLDTRNWAVVRLDKVFYSGIAADETNGRAFSMQSHDNVIRAFSLRTLDEVASYTVPGVTHGELTRSLVAIGSTGLALVAADRVLIIPVSDVLADPPSGG